MPIHGPVLLGFGDYFVGTVKPLAKPVKAAPKGKPLAVVKGKVALKHAQVSKNPSHHAVALTNLVTVANKTHDVIKKAQDSVAKYKADKAAGKHAPLVPVAVTKIHGDGTVILGAAPAVARKLTPRAQAAVEKHAKLLVKHKQATVALDKVAKKAKQVATKSSKLVADVAHKLSHGFTPGSKTTRIHGEDIVACIGLIDEILGQDDGSMYDSSMDTGTDATPIDHSQYGQAGGLDASGSGVVTDPNGNTLYDPSAPDADLTTLPTRGGTLSPGDAQVVWQHVPTDAVVASSCPSCKNGVGSWQTFYDTDRNKYDWGHGFLFGQHNSGPKVQWTIGPPIVTDPRTSTSNAWIDRTTGSSFGTKYSKGKTVPQLAQQSSEMNYGPLIGNPGVGHEGTSDFAGLQYAIADDKWFWQAANAPAAVTTAIDQAITDANNAIIATKQQAALVVAAAMQKDAIAQQEAKAKQDAALALQQSQQQSQQAIAESAAQSAANIAQSQQGTQQGQQQLAAYQEQIPIAAAQDQQQIAQQQGIIDQAATWNAYARKNPEAAMAQMQQAAPAEQVEPADDMDDGSQKIDDGSQSEDNGDDF